MKILALARLEEKNPQEIWMHAYTDGLPKEAARGGKTKVYI